MATIKFWQEMQRVVTIDGQDKLMIGKNSTGEAMYVNMEDINQFLSIVGTAVKPIPGGSTEATAVVLQPNASGQTREMNNVTGWFKNPTGSAWEAPINSINSNWWDGSTWSLGSSMPLPINPADGLVILGETKAPNGDKVWDYIRENLKVSTVTAGSNLLYGIGVDDFIVGQGLLANGLTSPANGFNTLKLYIPLSAGEYTTNIYLTAATSLITFDKDFNIVNVHNAKGTSNGDLPWTFTISGTEKYIRYCYSNGQTTPYINTTSDVLAFLPSKVIDSNIVYKLFVQENDYNKIGKASSRFKPFLSNITKSGFDPRSFVNIELIQGTADQLKTSTGWKDLYVVYQRYMTFDSVESTLFQIGEKVGTSVGVNLNLVSSYSAKLSEDSKGLITLELNQSNNSGLRFAVTIDTKYLRSLIDTSFDLGGSIQLNTRFFESQAIAIKSTNIQMARQKTFLLNPFVDTFNYRSIVSVEPTIASINDLEGLDLYITFLRFKGFDSPTTTTIVQISKLVTGVYTVVATCSLDKSIDADGLITADLTPSNDSNLWFRVTIDTKYLIQGVDTLQSLNNKVRLNVPDLVSKINGYYNSKSLVRFGDSTTEFNTSNNLSRNLGYRVTNVGLGGTRIAKHSNQYYDKLSFYNIANAIANNNWVDVDAAVLYIKNNLGDDNTPIITRLKAIDFSKIDIITIGYGTNDFTGGNALGAVLLDNVDTETTAGALNYALIELLTKFPNLKVFVKTPTHRFFVKDWTSDNTTLYDSDLATNAIGKYLIEYVDVIKGMAQLNHIPVKDMYRDGQFNKYNHSLYFGDGVHPNVTGYVMLDNMEANFIKSNMY